MIASFADPRAEALFHGERGRATRRLPPEILASALRKLDVLDGAQNLDDLRSPPGHRLEALRGKLAGFFSIRINEQWRIVFRWTDGQAYEVQIVDYH